MADDSSKREEDRINRTLNNIGRRGPRPTSWNVAQAPSLSGPVGSIGRNTNAAAVKSIQEQIREEERRQHALQAQHFSHSPQPFSPQPSSPSPPPQAVPQSVSPTPAFNGGSALGDTEDDRKMKLEEERLERWMKKGDSRFEENRGGFDPRQRSISVDSSFAADQVAAASDAFATTKLHGLAVKFQDQVYQASKALRHKKSEDVVKHSFNAAITAKAIAETLSDDEDIYSYARALEAGVSTMRTSVDSGGDGLQYYNEVAGYLGQLFISTIGVI